MRDYNAIQFRSPSEKQKPTVSSLSYSPGLISTVRSTSLSPIPRVGHSNSHHYKTGATDTTTATSQSAAAVTSTTTDDRTQSGHSGVTSTTVTSSTSAPSHVDMDTIRLPYLPTEHKPLQQQQQQQQQQSSSIASTNVVTNTSTTSSNSFLKPRLNQVASLSQSPPQRTSNNKSYRSSSPVENAMSLSPTPYHITTGSGNNNNNNRDNNHHPNSHRNPAIHPTNTVPTTTATTTIIPNSSNASVTSVSSTAAAGLVLSPTDALALRRDYNNNYELYIQKLRTDIEQQQMTIQKISSASSKSDAVILELRSTIRQYKRQLDKLQQQQQQQLSPNKVGVAGNDAGGGGNNSNTVDTSFNSGTGTSDPNQLPQVSPPLSDSDVQNHPLVVELTEQLHDLQNKLMTADLIRKELEDTIEAEQYTWELRVQDLEREVHELKLQLATAVANQAGGSNSSNNNINKAMVEPTTASRSVDVTNSNNNTNLNEMSDDYRKQLEDAQNEIQRYRSIIMTTTTTSDLDDDHMNHNHSMNTDASSTNHNNNNSQNILIWKEKVQLLEQERMELQGCLDEALKELEAVDLELQQEDTANTLREENERLQQVIQQLQQSQQPSQPRGMVALTDSGTNDTTAVMEQLQHLYRWLLERDGTEESLQSIRMMPQQYRTVEDLIHVVQEHIDLHCTSINFVQDLERQISVHKGDIHAREEETNEIRNSLKEAVSLLRPIQDSLAKLEKEKGKYQESLEGLHSQNETNLAEIRKYKQLLNDKDDEIDQMKQNIESLEIQLSKAKLVVANTVVAQHNLGNSGSTTSRSVMMMDLNNNDISAASPSDALDEKRAKRRSGENNLKELLRDAQLRGDSAVGDSALEREQQLRTIQEYEQEISSLRDELAKNDATIQSLQLNLTQAKDELLSLKQHSGADESTTSQMQQAELRVQHLEEELQDTKRALASKRDAERSLNKSLKDALGLIKPLQIHLEESEMEKRQMEQELEAILKQHERNTNSSGMSRSVSNGTGNNEISNAVSVEVVKELETTVRQLEKENAMLQDALEDMSQSLNASHISGAASPNRNNVASKHHPNNSSLNGTNSNVESTRLHQEFVELQSRYEVTQTRLKDAYHENHTLSELVQQEQDEKYMLHDEVTTLREQLILQQQPPSGR